MNTRISSILRIIQFPNTILTKCVGPKQLWEEHMEYYHEKDATNCSKIEETNSSNVKSRSTVFSGIYCRTLNFGVQVH